VPLVFHPVFQALKVDQAHRPSALAREDEWVVLAFFGAPAEAAVYLLGLTKASFKILLT
jgi:hypothetical protein